MCTLVETLSDLQDFLHPLVLAPYRPVQATVTFFYIVGKEEVCVCGGGGGGGIQLVHR